MVVEIRAAKIVDMADLRRQIVVLHDGGIRIGSLQAALGAAAIVANDVEHKRIARDPSSLSAAQQPADFVIGVREKARIDLHLPRI